MQIKEMTGLKTDPSFMIAKASFLVFRMMLNKIGYFAYTIEKFTTMEVSHESKLTNISAKISLG